MAKTLELTDGLDTQTLREMVQDLEAYYRSDVFIENYSLAKVGAKMMVVHRMKKFLGMDTETWPNSELDDSWHE